MTPSKTTVPGGALWRALNPAGIGAYKRLIGVVALCAATAGIVWNIGAVMASVGRLLSILSPVVIGLSLTYFLDWPVAFLVRNSPGASSSKRITRNIWRWLSMLLCYAIVISSIALVVIYLIPLVITSTQDLVNWLSSALLGTSGLGQNVAGLENLSETLGAVLQDFTLTDIVPHLGAGVGSLGTLAMSLTSGLINAVVAVVISVYGLIYKDWLMAGVSRFIAVLFGQKRALEIRHSVRTANSIFRKFIAAQVLDAVVLGTLATILLMILGVRFAVAFGVLLGFCNLIPKFGSIFGSLFVIAVTFFTGTPALALLTAASLLILQQIDGNIIGPAIVGDALKLNPIVVLTAIIVGGAYFGILGMILAIPLTAIIKIALINFIQRREAQAQTVTVD
jgi:predicted PurR-regulated permease PerM